jgi:hypothetical protein
MRRLACSAAWGKHDSKCHQRVLQTGRTSRLGHRSMAGECSAAGHEKSHGHTLSPVWRIRWALLNRVVPGPGPHSTVPKDLKIFSREQAGAAGLARSLQPSVVCYRIVCGCGQYGVRYGPRRRRSGCTAQAESVGVIVILLTWSSDGSRPPRSSDLVWIARCRHHLEVFL